MLIEHQDDEPQDEGVSLRDAIEQAFDDPGAEQGATPGEDAPAPAEPRPAEAAPVDNAEGPPDTEGADSTGDQGAADGSTAEDAGQRLPLEAKAPASWTVKAREYWAKLPGDVQNEVQKREREIQTKLNETAHERKTAEAFQKVWKPYEQFIRAENSDPLTAAENMFRTAAALRVGTAADKAQLVAGMVQQFGVDITMLDQYLSGAQVQQQPQQPQQQAYRDPRVDQLFQSLEQQQQQQADSTYNAAVSEMDAWSADKEFFQDLRAPMADIMELAERRGVSMSYDEAYNQAIALSPDHAQVQQQRNAAAAAAETPAARRARRAASSLRSSPAGGQGPQSPGGLSLRDSITQAMEE